VYIKLNTVTQTIIYKIVRGKPILKKSLKEYPPGPKTIRFVWYPIGVIKLAAAPKQTTKINGATSYPIVCDTEREIGNIIATAALFVMYEDNRFVMRKRAANRPICPKGAANFRR